MVFCKILACLFNGGLGGPSGAPGVIKFPHGSQGSRGIPHVETIYPKDPHTPWGKPPSRRGSAGRRETYDFPISDFFP